MIICIGLRVEQDIAKCLIRDLCEFYRLELIPGHPIVIIPSEDRAFFYAECNDDVVLQALDVDEFIDYIWYEPEFTSGFDDVPVGDSQIADRLNSLLKRDVDLNG